MSLFWSQWYPAFWNADCVRNLVDDWHIQLIRAAMAVEHGGYLTNPVSEKQKVITVVDAAIDNGIYVIIDWHDHNAENHKDNAKAFFAEMAQKYQGIPNVFFEIFNEPEHQSWSDVIKPYHEAIIPAIRTHSQNLILLGSRNWDQAVDEACRDPVTISDNLAYTIHFYATSHGQSLRDKALTALSGNGCPDGKGIALFGTEWGTTEYTGNGAMDFVSSQEWLDFFEDYHISDANWAVEDKDESCAVFVPGTSGTGPWDLSDLTESGRWIRASLRGDEVPSTDPVLPTTGAPGDCSETYEDCRSTRCCNDKSLTCYKKDDWWGSCKEDCVPGTIYDDPPWNTPWDCEELA